MLNAAVAAPAGAALPTAEPGDDPRHPANLFSAFAYNVFGISLAAGMRYPWLGVLLSPTGASAAMAASSISVIANALRLRTIKLGGFA
jgi:hypothetical protein